MNLKIYTTKEAPAGLGPRASKVQVMSVRMYCTGRFWISGCACDKLHLAESDGVAVAQDERFPGDWYIIPTPVSEGGYPLKANNGRGGGLSFDAARVSKHIIKACGLSGDSTYVVFPAKKCSEGLMLATRQPKVIKLHGNKKIAK